MNKRIMNFCRLHPVWVLVVLSSISAFCAVFPVLVSDGFRLTMHADFVDQQVSFPAMLHNFLTMPGTGEWTWQLDLGSSIVNGLAFYNLGSPFTWLGQLFSNEWFPYAIAWLLMFKYVCISLCAYWYLRLFVKPSYAVLGALLYSFSGFQAGNTMFYHFHDMVAFFPLLLVGLEKILRGESGLWFSGFVFLCAMTNYYFFVSESVFLALYFVCRCIGKPWRERFQLGLYCLMYYVVGVCMAACLLVPSVLYLAGNPRTTGGRWWSVYLFGREKHWPYVLNVLKGLFFPADSFTHSSAVLNKVYSSTYMYLPVVSLAGCFAYWKKFQFDWLGILLAVLLVCSLSANLSSAFLLVVEMNHRWWFMFSLMVVLATCLVLETRSCVCWGTVVCLVLTVLVYGLILAFSTVFDPERLLFLFAVAVSGLALFFLWDRFKLSVWWLVLLVAAFGSFQQYFSLSLYSMDRDPVVTKADNELGLSLENPDDLYRYGLDYNLYVMPGSASGIGAFSSTIENGSRKFSQIFGNESSIFTYMADLPGWSELLGGKYVFGPSGVVTQPAAPIVRYADGYVLVDDLLTLPRESWTYPVLNHVLTYEPIEGYPELDISTMDVAVQLSVEDKAVSDFARDKCGFSFTTDKDEDSLVETSIPYSSGWKATIGGVDVPVLDGAGMIALSVPAGEHSVKFVYHTPGLRLGCIISIFGFFAFGLLCWKRALAKN